MIYVLTMQSGKFVKVGYTGGTVEARIAALQTSSPFQLDELFSVEGALRQEQALHGSLRVAFHRIRIPIPGNEWYPGRCPFMQQFLDALRSGGPSCALAFAERYNPAVRQFGTSPKFAAKTMRRLGQERRSA